MSSNYPIVTDSERDAVFGVVLSMPENKHCFECKASNPKWASVNNGIFLCFHCAGKHRGKRVQDSFIRSCVYDKWNSKQLKGMELGGNKNANNYFEKNGLIAAGCFDYSSPMAAKYRSELGKKAEAAVASHAPRVDQEVVATVEEEVPRKYIKIMLLEYMWNKGIFKLFRGDLGKESGDIAGGKKKSLGDRKEQQEIRRVELKNF